MGRGFDYGGELSATVTVTNRWRITAGYSYLQMHTSLEPGSKDTSLDQFLGDSPKMQAQVRSTMNLPHRLEWDSFWSYVGPLRTGPVPSYVRVDTRLGRRIGESGEFSIGGQNLLTPHHPEFLDALQTHEADASRSVFAKLTWRF
jgi:iron complex outermembrane receptor protein